MAEMTQPTPTVGGGWSAGRVLLALLPLLGLGIAIALIFLTTSGILNSNLPPVEDLTVERVTLPAEGMIELTLINGGADPVTIAQVIVDDAYWQFEVQPNNTVPRLGWATVTIPYPWIADEAHAILLVTSTGATFDAEIPLAVQSPGITPTILWQYGLLGFYVGVVPVGLGLLWYPLLRGLGRQGLNLILSLTVGLLIFLFFDTILEALEIAGTLPGVFSGQPLVWMLTLLTVLVLMAISQRAGPTSRWVVAAMIALGIGLHNLGEGLAIGAALASGEAALGVFLVIGFTLHNITEGVGIAAPLARDQTPWWRLALLGLVAGVPAILGTWIGGFAYSPLFTTIFLAIGAGAILQVVYAVGELLWRDAQKYQEPFASRVNVVGLAIGIAIMYFTALLVTA
jgi:ZIP family zinc transporter